MRHCVVMGQYGPSNAQIMGVCASNDRPNVGKRRNSWLPSFSPLSTMFSNASFFGKQNKKNQKGRFDDDVNEILRSVGVNFNTALSPTTTIYRVTAF